MLNEIQDGRIGISHHHVLVQNKYRIEHNKLNKNILCSIPKRNRIPFVRRCNLDVDRRKSCNHRQFIEFIIIICLTMEAF